MISSSHTSTSKPSFYILKHDFDIKKKGALPFSKSPVYGITMKFRDFKFKHFFKSKHKIGINLNSKSPKILTKCEQRVFHDNIFFMKSK